MICFMGRTNIYLDDEQTASLDRLAEQPGVSRAADVSAIENSFGAVQYLEFPARRPSDRDAYLTELWRHAQ